MGPHAVNTFSACFLLSPALKKTDVDMHHQLTGGLLKDLTSKMIYRTLMNW
jgi:hypothetical protein